MITIVKMNQVHNVMDEKITVRAELVATDIPEKFPENGAGMITPEGHTTGATTVFAPGSTLWVPSKDKVFLYDGAAWCDVSKRFTYTHSFM